MKYVKIAGVFIIVLFSVNAFPIDFNSILNTNPLITIDRDTNGAFKSVTVYSIIKAPFNTVWNTVTNISDYKKYMNRIERLEIIKNDREKNIVIADYEVDAPIFNVEYQLKYSFDKKNREIRIERHKGSLEGSVWLWKFEIKDNYTFVTYSGRVKNYSPFFEKFDDEKKTIAVGVNISTFVSMVNYMKDRAEALYKEKTRFAKKG